MTSANPPRLDVLGVGFGPANLALAIALDEADAGLDVLFLEGRDVPVWQDTMMLDGSNIQNHPVRDLVSLRNPRSRYSFINFLFENDRLLAHLNLPREYPLRKEYAQYISWVAGHFAHRVRYGSQVTSIATERVDDELLYLVGTADRQRYLARSLVLAPGRTPFIPEPFDAVDCERVFHLTRYVPQLSKLVGEPTSVAVIGGSQSAVEIILDLARRYPGARIVNFVRSFGLRLKDTSPFSEEGYFPGFTDYYFNASTQGKRKLDAYMRATNYSSADADVLHELYAMIYEQRLDGAQRVFVQGNRQIVAAAAGEDGISLQIKENITGETETDRVDAVVLATGFRDVGPGEHQEPFPKLMTKIIDRFVFSPDGQLRVNQDYTVEPLAEDTPPLFLNGLCETTHGIGDAGSFSLLSLRADTIGKALLRHRKTASCA